MVEFSKSVAIFRWLLSARSQNSQDFLPKCHWDFRVLFRNFFWPSQSQICKHYNDFFVSFRSSPLSWISAKNVKNLDILHPHAHHQPLKIENSTIISLYILDKCTYTFLLSEKTKQIYFGMQNFSIIKNYPKY